MLLLLSIGLIGCCLPSAGPPPPREVPCDATIPQSRSFGSVELSAAAQSNRIAFESDIGSEPVYVTGLVEQIDRAIYSGVEGQEVYVQLNGTTIFDAVRVYVTPSREASIKAMRRGDMVGFKAYFDHADSTGPLVFAGGCSVPVEEFILEAAEKWDGVP